MAAVPEAKIAILTRIRRLLADPRQPILEIVDAPEARDRAGQCFFFPLSPNDVTSSGKLDRGALERALDVASEIALWALANAPGPGMRWTVRVAFELEVRPDRHRIFVSVVPA